MNKILIISLIIQAVLAVRSNEFHSHKLGRQWWTSPKSEFHYKKDNNWFSSFQHGGINEFYEGEFETRIDHFRPLNQQRVNFTYNVNANHFEDFGPLFVYLKDTFDYSTQWIENGLMVDIANQTGAALFTFDYRFFGQNRPFANASFESLEFLSVEQVLADVAEFIRFIRQSLPTAQFSRVILWGSGVGGSIGVFARSRYPHLVYATWSSSGILESAPYSWGAFDTFEYTFNINDGGQCRNLIQTAYEEMANLVIAGEGEELATRTNLCYPVNTTTNSDVAALYENSIRAILYYIDNYHYQGVVQFCQDLTAVEGDPLYSFARWLRYVYGDAECFDPSYATAIERYSNIEWDQFGTTSGRRQFYFLQCTQVGSFSLADQYTWLPGTVDLAYHLQKCEDLFGIPFTYATISSAFYALRDTFTLLLPNVLYTNGNLDPFRYFGRLYDPSNLGIVLNIDYAAKSADLPSLSLNDLPSIYAAKETIIDIITTWAVDQPPIEPPTTDPPVTETPTGPPVTDQEERGN